MAQMVWSGLLCLSGTYQSLIEYVAFALILFFAATGFSVIILRRKAQERERPFRVPGYPILPLLYVGLNAAIFVAVILSRPVQSLAGAALILAGLPTFFFWSSKNRPLAQGGGRP
jgi:APA family basic amino acid/polyamine antiporter